MAAEGSGARIVRNTLATGAGQFLAVGISIALTPFLIRGLGTEAYGVFVLALTFTFFGGWAALADLGVEGAAVRYVAEARAGGSDVAAVNRTVSTAMLFFSGLALLIAPVLVVAAQGLVGVFSIGSELQDEARLLFGLVACQLVFELPARALFAVLQGSQRFGTFQAIEVSRALVQAALFIVVLVTGGGLVQLGLAMLAASALVLMLAWVYSRRAMPDLRLSPRNATRDELRRLVTFGGGLLATRVIGTLFRQMDKLIIGTVLGARLVTPYDVANKVQAGVAMVQTIAASSLLPATAYIRERQATLRDLYLRGSSYTVAATIPVLVGAFVLAGPLIEGWVGSALADDATTAARLFLLYLAIILPHVVGQSMLVALGRIRPVLGVASAALVINAAVSLALVSPLGIEGVVLGTVAANAVTTPFLFVVSVREFDVDVRGWLAAIAVPNVPGLLAQAALAVPLLALAEHVDSLPFTVLLLGFSVLVSLAVYVTIGLKAAQRTLLIETFRQALGSGGRAGANAPS